MALVGLLAGAFCLNRIMADSMNFRVEGSRGALLAVKEKAPVRSMASAKSAVLMTVRQGRRMTPIGYEGGWYKVRV